MSNSREVWPIVKIKVGTRHRTNSGNLTDLVDSIREVGLLHPIVVRPDKTLVSGMRRLEAAKVLGWKEMPVHVVKNLDDALRFLQAERDENVCRLGFTHTEALSVQRDWEKLFKPEAEKAETSGKSSNGKAGGRGKRNPSPNKTRVSNSRKTKVKAAKATGYSAATLAKVEEIEKATKSDKRFAELLEQLSKPGCKVDRIYKLFKAKVKEKELEAAEISIKVYESEPDVRHCSMQELLPTLEKVDAIITDPPYPEKFLPLYGELAKLAKGCLKENGILAVMIGQSYLPRILVDMVVHIPYRWTLAYLTPGGQSVQLWARKVNTFWKPVLIFGGIPNWMGDVIRSDVNDNDKRFHGWGQSESGMARLVDALTKPGQLVCDPFLGAGTTGVVCARLARRFVGCDSDAKCVRTATVRIQEANND